MALNEHRERGREAAFSKEVLPSRYGCQSRSKASCSAGVLQVRSRRANWGRRKTNPKAH